MFHGEDVSICAEQFLILIVASRCCFLRVFFFFFKGVQFFIFSSWLKSNPVSTLVIVYVYLSVVTGILALIPSISVPVTISMFFFLLVVKDCYRAPPPLPFFVL